MTIMDQLVAERVRLQGEIARAAGEVRGIELAIEIIARGIREKRPLAEDKDLTP